MRRCGECGKFNLKIQDIKGRKFPYKQYDSVEILVSLENEGILCCQDCDNIIVRSGASSMIDKAIVESLKLQKKSF